MMGKDLPVTKRKRRKRNRNGLSSRRAVRHPETFTVEPTVPGRDQHMTIKTSRGVRLSLRQYFACEDGGGI